MRVWVAAPVRRHGREEVRRNLLRLAAYQELVLEAPGVVPAQGVPASPVACGYEALAVGGLLCAGFDGSRGGRRWELAPGYLAYLLALLARMEFAHMGDGEGRSVFLGSLAAALGGVEVEAAPVGLLHHRLRRRLLEAIGRLRGGGGSRGGGGPGAVVAVGVSVYYLGDALGVFTRLAPPRRAPWPLPTSTTSPGSLPRWGTRSG